MEKCYTIAKGTPKILLTVSVVSSAPTGSSDLNYGDPRRLKYSLEVVWRSHDIEQEDRMA